MDSSTKGVRRYRVVVTSAIALLAAALVWLATAGASALQCCEAPVSADLMVVLAGGSRERLLTAIELYRKNLAVEIMVTDPHGFPDTAFRFLESAGVPPRALLAASAPSRNTFEDALRIREQALRRRARSLLVVTSAYHCRRTQMILNRVMGESGTRVTVTSSASLYMDSEHWWKSRQGWNTVPQEFLKVAWAWLMP